MPEEKNIYNYLNLKKNIFTLRCARPVTQR